MLILVVAALFHAVTAQYYGSGKCAEPKWMCHQTNGDGAGGSEALVKTNVASLQDCFKLVKKADDKANGATWGKKNKKCYKELGMTKINSNSNYVTCFIVADTRRRALASQHCDEGCMKFAAEWMGDGVCDHESCATCPGWTKNGVFDGGDCGAEKAVGQFSFMDGQNDDQGNSKATYHKKGGEACTQHYECESHHCVWTADMSGIGGDKPKGKVHCGDGFRTTSCDACTYGQDEPDWCGGDCEWDGWDCVDASAVESQVGFRANVASPTPTTSTADVVTYGFAALGASVLFYGAFRHYTSSSKGDSQLQLRWPEHALTRTRAPTYIVVSIK